MSELQDSAYILGNNLDRFEYVASGEGYDLQAFSFDGVMQLRKVDENKILDLPQPTFFCQHRCPEYLNELDSFSILEGCPIFSQRMIDVLISVSSFQYKKYPISVLAQSLLEEEGNINPYENVDKFRKLSLRNDLFIFQTLEPLDIFDWEKSDYRQRDYNKEVGTPGHIRKFVLKPPESNFPPLFRLIYPPSMIQSVELFISKEAREALKNSGIKGPDFTSLLRPRGSAETDVPIEEIRSVELAQKIDKHQRRIDRVFTRAEEERAKGNHPLADRLEQEAHDLMRMPV